MEAGWGGAGGKLGSLVVAETCTGDGMGVGKLYE